MNKLRYTLLLLFGAMLFSPNLLAKTEKLMEEDPHGAIMSTTAMVVVFIALILLYLVFKYYGKRNVKQNQKRAAIAAGNNENNVSGDYSETTAELLAAIAAALNAYYNDEEFHDIEDTVLTINKVTRNYSPWSSKIYTLRETPNKK